jgi:hypothetical protein
MNEQQKTGAGQGWTVFGVLLSLITLILGFIPGVSYLGLIPGVIGIVLIIDGLIAANKGNGPKLIVELGLGIAILFIAVAFVWITFVAKPKADNVDILDNEQIENKLKNVKKEPIKKEETDKADTVEENFEIVEDSASKEE